MVQNLAALRAKIEFDLRGRASAPFDYRERKFVETASRRLHGNLRSSMFRPHQFSSFRFSFANGSCRSVRPGRWQR